MSGRRSKAVRRFVAWWGERGGASLTGVSLTGVLSHLTLADVTFGESPAVRRKIEREVRRSRKWGVDYASSSTRRLVPNSPLEYASSTSRVRTGRRMGPGIRAAMLLAALSFPGAR